MLKVYLYIICYCFLFSCSFESGTKLTEERMLNRGSVLLDTESKPLVDSVSKSLVDSLPTFFFDTTTVEYNEYRVNVISKCLKDSLDYEKSFYIYPVCVSQHLYLYKHNLLVFDKLHNYGLDTVTTILGKRILVLNNVIKNVHLLRGEQECLVSFSGWGGCAWCTFYIQIYNFKGESLLMQLEDRTTVYEKYGNYKKICKAYKMSETFNEQKEYDDGFKKSIPSSPMAEAE